MLLCGSLDLLRKLSWCCCKDVAVLLLQWVSKLLWRLLLRAYVAAVLVGRLMVVGQPLFVDGLLDDVCLDDGLAQLDVTQHFSTLGT